MKLSDFIVNDAIVSDLQATDRNGAIRELVSSLAAAGAVPESAVDDLVAALIKREQNGSTGFGKGVAVPFLGRPAHSNTAPALMARNYGLKLYAARVIRRPGVRFSIRVEPVEVPVTEDRDADIVTATANIHARFEEFLLEAPEQWMWAHRRWD